MDRRCIPITLGGVFVRRGNFFNYEIVGKPHDLPWAVKFIKMDREYGKLVPRHTTQLYESLADRSSTGFCFFPIAFRKTSASPFPNPASF